MSQAPANRLCRSWITGNVWFYTQADTNRVILSVEGPLEKNPTQQIIDRVSDLSETIRAAFLKKIAGNWELREAADGSNFVVAAEEKNGAKSFYQPNAYNRD